VLNHVGDIPPEAEGPQWQLLVDVLTDIGLWGQRIGATLCAEVGRASPADLARLIAALPEAAVSCDLVTGALVVHGHDPVAAVETLGTHIESVHATDAVAGAFAGRGRAVAVGTGQVDLPAVFAALEERASRGWGGLEPGEERTAREARAAASEYIRAM
jgi:sugar phosphate isomerase/epimerase